MESLIYWSLVHKIWGVSGNKLLKNLMDNISGEEFWSMALKDINKKFPMINEEMAELFIYNRSKVSYETEKAKILKENIKIISIYQKQYPQRLQKIHQPPSLLYVKGEFTEKNLAIALVGARKASLYGQKIAQNLGKELSQNNVQVISGLARGIDTFGHLGAVGGVGGTVAILGSGINVVYPRENIGLYKQIFGSGNGCVISEFPLDTQPLKHNFPIRNRLISGLADGVVIIEAGEKSGSLITAEFALEQGREVFAVPGQVNNPMAKGPHKLIKEGAKLVEGVADILDEFGQLKFFEFDNPKNKPILNEVEEKILNVIRLDPLPIDDIVKETKLPFQSVMAALSLLEIKGLVSQGIGRRFMTLD